MDLGCIDMGCVEKESSPKESKASASKNGKNRVKDALRASSNALNKLTSQISKPPRRKTSPLDWFPRKKVEPYLKRKIRMLQEVDGMHLTLDETLEDSNPHYSKVLREKIAIREAAEKAMEARKAAMVEASWCRILQAAGIDSKGAEEQLAKAELSAAEAFEAARAVGVIVNGTPDSAPDHYKIETISGKGGSTTHRVSAAFETEFAVDKQVAAAVKAAFVKLGNCHSIDKDEFKELLHKISENPETDELSAITSECESDDAGSEVEGGSCKDSLKKPKKRPESDKFNMTYIVDMMLGRLQCLKEEELASLATIVATSGLNAALAETENSSAVQNTENPCPKVSRRTSVSGTGRAAKNSRGAVDAEIPSLDQFLVKRLTRLEREVLEAKNASKNEASDGRSKGADDGDSSSRSKVKINDDGATVPDLGSVMTKHKSKLEKEIEEARRTNSSSSRGAPRAKQVAVDVDVPSLDKYLVKRLTRLEMEVQEARNRNRLEAAEKPATHLSDAKENIDLNRIEDAKPISLEDQKRKRQEAQREERSAARVQKLQRKDEEKGANYESLDKVLVKHVSRLEKEKSEFCGDERVQVKPRRRELESTEGSLDQVLVKPKSRLERAKMGAAEQEKEDSSTIRYSVTRREARERELQAAWGGMSLGNSMRPHVSRLQKDKAAWLEAEEEERSSAGVAAQEVVQSS